MFCFAPPAAWAQAPRTEASAGAAPNRGALFKIERDGHTLFLFGTIHVGAPDFYPLEPRVMAALAQASVLALEVDLGADSIGLRSAMREFGLYSNGGTAMAEIGPAFRPRLKRLLRHYGIDQQAVAPMKPWLLASVLAVSEFAAQGYQTSLAVDSYLARQARERNIPVRELETVAGQMALFGRLPLADQSRFLEESIATIEDRTQARQARSRLLAGDLADHLAADRRRDDPRRGEL
ncbi:MAG: TraB/GumN family protein, partial [Burkholderiaceae bacterium]|nr:TraB/GumN family protein [Burkholderiaceae bacterium]